MSDIRETDLLSLDGWMVGWNPVGWGGKWVDGSVEVGPWPDKTGWSDKYRFTTGCCWLERSSWGCTEKVLQMFIDFHSMIVRDGIIPADAHLEFMKISEYRSRVSPELLR